MTDTAPSRLGNKVRSLRCQGKLSQGELATRLGISASDLNLIENNHRPLPGAVLIRLAQLFQVELSNFDADEESRPSESLFETFLIRSSRSTTCRTMFASWPSDMRRRGIQGALQPHRQAQHALRWMQRPRSLLAASSQRTVATARRLVGSWLTYRVDCKRSSGSRRLAHPMVARMLHHRCGRCSSFATFDGVAGTGRA
jgi:transcriptional regulator with XRE-family HTH domain